MKERITTAGIAIRDGKVLVAKRVDGGALSGMWEFPGGKNRYGESLEDTLRREYREELGVEITFLREIFCYDFVNKDTLYHLKGCLIALDDVNFTLSVHTRTAFVSAKELKELKMGDSDSHLASFLIENNFF